MDLITGLILPALITPFSDIVKRLASRWLGRSVDEEIKLMQAETEKLKVLAELDKPSENISVWVANLRASFRYIVVGFVVVVTAVIGVLGFILSPEARPVIISSFLEFASACTSFIIGNRIYLSLKR